MNEMNEIIKKKNDYLSHHGILGQKWGVRRFQNRDGSLTPQGKNRYLNKFGSLNKEGKEQQANKEAEISSLLKNKDVSAIINAQKKFYDGNDDLKSAYEQAYNRLRKDKDFKDAVYAEIEKESKEYGMKPADFFSGADIDDIVLNVSDKFIEPIVKDKVQAFYKNGDAYFDSVKSVANEFINNIGFDTELDSAINTSTHRIGKNYVEKAIAKYTDTDLSLSAYLYKNAEEYCKYESESLTTLQSDFARDYEKKYGTVLS